MNNHVTLSPKQQQIADEFWNSLVHDTEPQIFKVFQSAEVGSAGLDVVELASHCEIREFAFLLGITCGMRIARTQEAQIA